MTDEELMAAVCSGDQQAYQTLVRQHLPAISHYAYRLLGSDKDTEDITQETFLRLWTQAEKWRPEKSRLTTWLHRISHNLCIDHLRKLGRIATVSDGREELDTAEDEAGGAAEAEAARRNSEHRMALIQDALGALPESQRSAIMLCHYSGFSNREAADIMGLSIKALESALVRGRQTLRQILKPAQSVKDQSA